MCLLDVRCQSTATANCLFVSVSILEVMRAAAALEVEASILSPPSIVPDPTHLWQQAQTAERAPNQLHIAIAWCLVAQGTSAACQQLPRLHRQPSTAAGAIAK